MTFENTSNLEPIVTNIKVFLVELVKDILDLLFGYLVDVFGIGYVSSGVLYWFRFGTTFQQPFNKTTRMSIGAVAITTS